MKARIKTQVLIQASPTAVFDYLVQPSYHYLWNPHLLRVTPDKKLELGATYEASSKILGVRTKAINHVDKLLADQELELSNRTGMLQYSVNYRLAAVDGRTELVCTTIVSAEGKAFAFARPMLEQLARRELKTDLQALKNAVEQQLQP